MRRILFSAVGLFLRAVTGLVGARTYEGHILGTVTNQSGTAVKGARIVITNDDTSAAREVLSDEVGDYVAPSLTPGVYRVIAEFSGFKKAQWDAVRLEVGKDLRIDLTLASAAADHAISSSA